MRSSRKRMHRISILSAGIVLLLAASGANAQSRRITLDATRTRISWKLGDVLHTVEGTFALKSGTIEFDAQSGDATGQIVVDATSGTSGNGMRDSKMKKDVLESPRYPEIVFTPQHVSGFTAGSENSTVQVTGNFAIHGGTHPLTMTLPVTVKGSHVEGRTQFDVPYEQWGMKNPSTLFLKVSNTVQISIAAVGEIQPSN